MPCLVTAIDKLTCSHRPTVKIPRAKHEVFIYQIDEPAVTILIFQNQIRVPLSLFFV